MKQTWWKISVVVILVVAIAVVIAQKQNKHSATPLEPVVASTNASTERTMPQTPPVSQPQQVAAAETPVKTGEVCPTPPPKVSNKALAKGTGQTTGVKGTALADSPKTTKSTKAVVAPAVKPASKTLPKLVDVGATQCIPCKMMAPILEELKSAYKGKLVVEFIDINENSDAAAQYGVDTIPTQIFYDANGKEFSRHVGFFPKDEILATFTKQGIKLSK